MSQTRIAIAEAVLVTVLVVAEGAGGGETYELTSPAVGPVSNELVFAVPQAVVLREASPVRESQQLGNERSWHLLSQVLLRCRRLATPQRTCPSKCNWRDRLQPHATPSKRPVARVDKRISSRYRVKTEIDPIDQQMEKWRLRSGLSLSPQSDARQLCLGSPSREHANLLLEGIELLPTGEPQAQLILNPNTEDDCRRKLVAEL